MLHTTFIISYFDPVQITITISYVFSILYHINVYRILLLMPASSVAIALAFRKNRSLGKTFWFTGNSITTRPEQHCNRNLWSMGRG
ncbi:MULTISPECIES: hypothetical protein [Nostocales]|uniref:Uncharacterized protein n=1 Tax=Dolichospermum flos-aquae UHCC 0037 TaxID=2590026 RepID=A0ACC7SB04_DOLFA|nr:MULTISPECIES: hypothetical protein [Nostocales]MBO1063260.1 hypothetical protein [Anabaena sp. 54]MTJ45585.1 hypothetical protein [Dolichospermum flos-aquae UHCC 0037]